MTEKDLGTLNFAFELDLMAMKEDWLKVAAHELNIQVHDLITKTGKYKITMQVSEILED